MIKIYIKKIKITIKYQNIYIQLSSSKKTSNEISISIIHGLRVDLKVLQLNDELK